LWRLHPMLLLLLMVVGMWGQVRLKVPWGYTTINV
jgi:hypothetical protein